MPNYRTTKLPCGFNVTEIMTFFRTCFDSTTLKKGRLETYPFWAMIYTHKGGVTFKIDDKEYHVGAGDIIFYPPNVTHTILSLDEKTWDVSFATFACEGEEMRDLRGRVFVPDGDTTDHLRALFKFAGPLFYNLPPKDDTIGMFCCGKPHELLYVKNELEAILSSLYLSTKNKTSGRTSSLFSSVTAYMEEHLGEPISLDQLAYIFGVSVSTLKKAFACESGGGVNQYYINMKLSHGAKMLCETELSVLEISERLGFSSQFYFSELFKKRYSLSPLSYRKQQKNNCREFL